ncbi:hypothetical protein [Candidatus Uabimicrobium amorphum]|uniref:Uncharacterized protein n=1 Tax=Uabimicrobium amorphum TaxID=2596890 RepID=A0A5S9IQP8_UABAM|nr:hypothetical protein [Candidatus Uabimicrobium amorphum]BBM85967.1 hypothetical protein UABAM_04353 [Candidatus Uabimicrobium amorphum]
MNIGKLIVVIILFTTWTYTQNFDAVERKLGEAVAEGHLSLDQAAAMMKTLREMASDKHHNAEEKIGAWIDSVGKKIKAAAMKGEISEKEAWEKWQHFKEHELAPKLKMAVAKGVVREKWAQELWHGIEKAEISEKLKAAVAKGEMTEQQAWEKWKEINKQDNKHHEIIHHYKRLGVSMQEMGNIKKSLGDAGVTNEQMEGAMRGILRTVHEMKSEGEKYEMDLGVAKFLRGEIKLSNKQIEMVQNIARRILHRVMKQQQKK